MNTYTVSAECLHGFCSACRYEDCACRCHWRDALAAQNDGPDIEDQVGAAEYEALWGN